MNNVFYSENNLFTTLTACSLNSSVSHALLGYKDTVVSKAGCSARLSCMYPGRHLRSNPGYWMRMW